MITETHVKKAHSISCKEYAERFHLKKGELNPHHSRKMGGKGNPRYGAVISAETRQKISNRHKQSGRFLGEGNPMFGRTHTPEVRARISKLHKGKFAGEKNAFFGKKHTEETKLKISRIRIKKGLAKGKNNPLFGKGHTQETKNKISLQKKELFRKHPEKHVNALIAKNYKNQKNKKGGYISKKQIEIYELLLKHFSDAKLNHPINTEGGLYFADVGIPSLNVDFEYDSSYWHQNKEKDKKRDNNIKKKGWRVIRVTDKEVRGLDTHQLEEHVVTLINT